MAASAALSVNVTAAAAPLSKEFQGLKASTSFSKVQSVVRFSLLLLLKSLVFSSVASCICVEISTHFSKQFWSRCMMQAMLPRSVKGKGALGARCDFIGSPTNIVSSSSFLHCSCFVCGHCGCMHAPCFCMYMSSNGGVSTRTCPSFSAHDDIVASCSEQIIVASTTLMLFAGRFGLAPSANRKALAGLKLVDRDSGLQTGDPAGFTATDTLACGVMGHIIGVGIVLGLKGIGVL